VRSDTDTYADRHAGDSVRSISELLGPESTVPLEHVAHFLPQGEPEWADYLPPATPRRRIHKLRKPR